MRSSTATNNGRAMARRRQILTLAVTCLHGRRVCLGGRYESISAAQAAQHVGENGNRVPGVLNLEA